MRVLGTVALSIVLLCGAATAQSPSVAPSAAPSAAGASQELLGFTFPAGSSDSRLVLVRTTLEPGDRLAGVGWAGSSVSWVESGSLTIDVIAGTMTVAETDHSGGTLADGETWTLGSLGTVRAGPKTVMDWTNDTAARVTVLTAAVIPSDASVGDPTSLPGASPAPTPTPGPKEGPPVLRMVVLRMVVLRGTGPFGQPSVITIRDRSGWVVGARVPDERELRGWPMERSGAGPVRATGRDTFELLLTWSGSGCGPVVTLTVEPRLRSMRLVDRSPGCDASAMGHWLVLRLRTTVGLPVRDIPVATVRRVPR